MDAPLQIDGSLGEGGGQILRSALALSMITARPFRIFNIRGNRPKPGLRRQHMTAVLAAAQICAATVTGADVDSRDVTFIPGPVCPGTYHFDIGSAGSTMLVLQTILPALITADAPSAITLVGGTHNFGAPPSPFLLHAFLPLLNRMGPTVDLKIDRAGFAPRGGGRARALITPAKLRPIYLLDRGRVRRTRAVATIASLPHDIADRELKLAARLLCLGQTDLAIEELPSDQGPGNLVAIHVESEHVTDVFSAFGANGTRAEDVARDASRQAKRYTDANVPVGEHLADQLLLPMALARGGSFVTGDLSLHATTNIDTIRRFLDVPINVTALDKHRNRIDVRP